MPAAPFALPWPEKEARLRVASLSADFEGSDGIKLIVTVFELDSSANDALSVSYTNYIANTNLRGQPHGETPKIYY